MGGHINKEMVSQIQYTITHSCILVRKLKKSSQTDILILL